MNVFTKNPSGRPKRKPRAAPAAPVARPRRGRPPGPTEQGAAARQRLYDTALKLFAAHGYEATTLRDIAKHARTSAGLLYRYFPSKQAVVLALYDELSAEYATRARAQQPGPWRSRFLFALETSLGVLARERTTLAALVPVLVGDPANGLFAPATAFSRERVQTAFHEAVAGATDAPANAADAAALGRVLYVLHLAIILWWLLDRSPHQRTTRALVETLGRLLQLAAPMLQLPPAWGFVRTADELLRTGLYGDPPKPPRPPATAEEPRR